VTVAGGHGEGDRADQLNGPHGLFVDEDQTVYIADYGNHRIMGWKAGATTGEVLAGGKGQGNRLDQLNGPTDVIVDRETDSLLICDRGNRRVMRWPRRPSSLRQPEIVIDNIDCWGLIMDDQGSLYVSDVEKHEVRRYDKNGDKKGTVVAGGHGEGDNLNQLNWPTYLFVDAQSTLYVSDYNNHRVMKWMKGAKEGIVVAGGNGRVEI
jgi:sugar lactone lactonase YvrE